MNVKCPVLGIDIAKETFEAALFLPDKNEPICKEFANTKIGHGVLLRWLTRNSANPCTAGVEATGNYGKSLMMRLHKAGHRTCLLHPKSVKNYARACGQRNKTDKQDALLIGRYVYVQEPGVWEPPGKTQREVREWLQIVNSLKDDRTRMKNRAEAAATSLTRHVWQAQVQQLENQLKCLEDQLWDLIKKDPQMSREWHLYQTIPGVGPNLALHLVALVDMRLFRSAKHLCSYAGVAPRNHESGTSVRRHSRVGNDCQRTLRRAVFQAGVAAMSPRSSSPTLATVRNRLKDGKRKLKGRALAMALGHKLLRICYGVHQRGEPFVSMVKESSILGR